jgi:hypothetical protein
MLISVSSSTERGDHDDLPLLQGTSVAIAFSTSVAFDYVTVALRFLRTESRDRHNRLTTEGIIIHLHPRSFRVRWPRQRCGLRPGVDRQLGAGNGMLRRHCTGTGPRGRLANGHGAGAGQGHQMDV